MRMLKGAAVVVACIALAACGGGGGNSGSSPFGGNSGGGGTTTPQAADVTLTLNKTSVSNTGSETVTATATAVDASRNALSGIPISIGVDSNAVAVVGGSATDSSGNVTATINLGTDRSNRIVTVTATSGALVRTAAFQVTGAKIQSTMLPAVVAPGAAAQVQYRLVDVNANPMVGQSITVSGPGITSATGTTGSNGDYKFDYTAPTTAGNLPITASTGGVTDVQTVLVQAGSGAIPPVTAGSVQSASVSANPSVVAVNTASTSNRSEIRALFLGANNAPTANVRVRFDLAGDPNSIGGTMSSGTNMVYSGADGVATAAYVPSSRSSPTDGVTVRACWDYDDFAAGVCPNAATTTLTVTSEALAVTIGTDNTITDGAGGLTYIKKYVVMVVDASGQAKADVQISPSIDLTNYYKGNFATPGAWCRPDIAGCTTGVVSPACPNEDANRNGVLEASENDGITNVVNGLAIPDNGNGKLDPRKSDVAISVVNGNKTNASGIAFVQIEYPKNVATWIDYVITVAASGVSGTEGRATWSDILGAEAGAFTADVAPPFAVSPYGRATNCSNPN